MSPRYHSGVVSMNLLMEISLLVILVINSIKRPAPFNSSFFHQRYFSAWVANVELRQTHKAQLRENNGREGHLSFAIKLHLQPPQNFSSQQNLLKRAETERGQCTTDPPSCLSMERGNLSSVFHYTYINTLSF